MSVKSKLDSYDLEFLKRELLGAVAESQATRVLQKLDELKEEMYLDRLELENDRVFGEPPGGSSGKTVPGNFEPIFAPDAQDDYKVKLDRVGFGFCPFGRGFYSGPDVDSSAKTESGVIYLEVQHPGPSGSDPTIYVKGAPLSIDLTTFFTNRSDTTKTLIPLYSIAGGAITVDYRSCMSLPMREL